MTTASEITLRDLKRAMEKFQDERDWKMVDPVVFYPPAFYSLAKDLFGHSADVRRQEPIPMSSENTKNGG